MTQSEKKLFQFTISDLGIFLGKSPVTIRAWERKGMIRIPREGGKRVMTTNDVLDIASIAQDIGRVTLDRWYSISMAIKALEKLES